MKKSPGIAALLSFFVPGAGFIYTERFILGIVYFLWWCSCIYNVFHPASMYGEKIILLITWIVGILFSAKTAKTYNNRIDKKTSGFKSQGS